MPRSTTLDLSFRPKSYRRPRRTGGEDETIIARVVLATRPREILTLRAKRTVGGRIRYRLLAEEASGRRPRRIRTSPVSSTQPLALGELIQMLDGACYHGACADPADQDRYGGVIWGTLQLHFEHGIDGADAYLGFAAIASDFYPQLEAYYLDRMGKWCLERCVEHEDCRRVVRMRLNRG